MGHKIFAVIPVHNGIEHTLPTVRALLPLMPPPGRIVVVDDGSTDGTSDLLHREHPEVIVLRGDGNLWWSGATNWGARCALEKGADYVLFLNNDVILHPQFLEELLIGAREFPGALIASKILSTDEPWKVWSMGGKLDWLRGKVWMLGHGGPDLGRWREPVEADWLPGMSILVPIQVFRQGIWLDRDNFPQYAGDSDFSMRARRAGFKLVVWPQSLVYNKINHSGLDTKLLLGIEPFSFRLFFQTFTSVKSSKAFRTFGKWMLRHTPVWSWPMMLARSYGFYLLKCLQIWLRLPGFARRRTPGLLDKKQMLPKRAEIAEEQLQNETY